MTRRILFVLGMAALTCVAGCLDPIESAQLRLVGEGSQASFDGNPDVVDGRASAAGGITLTEGLAAVLEIRAGDGDPTSKDYENSGTLTVAEGDGQLRGLRVEPMEDLGLYMVLVSRTGDGALASTASFTVASSSYEGQLIVPVRVLRQEGHDHVVDLELWPYEKRPDEEPDEGADGGSGGANEGAGGAGAGGSGGAG